MLAGHDYRRPRYSGVALAVDEKFLEHVIEKPDWVWIVKM